MELADMLLKYKDKSKRKDLLNFIYSDDIKEFTTGFLKEANDNKLDNIDPFTTIGIFNRGKITENTDRKRGFLAKKFKEFFNMKSDIPSSSIKNETPFMGVPVLHNLKSLFFDTKNYHNNSNIDNLWHLFDYAIQYSKNENVKEDFCKYFDIVRVQRHININITMGFFWVRPNTFISLDSNNRTYLKQFGININLELPLFNEYLNIISKIKRKMDSGEIKEKSFPVISYNAWPDKKYCLPLN
jgi:5-methylcytosine-specific restriction protein B